MSDAAAPGIAYTPRIEGPLDDDLRDLLKQTSRLFRFRDRAPASIQQLGRRAESDVESFRTVLRSQGYYAPDVRYRLLARDDGVEAILQVAPGPAFGLAAYRVRYADLAKGALADLPRNGADLGLEIGGPARAAPILEAEKTVLRRLANAGRPFARVADRKAVADYAKHTVSVDLTVDAGPAARFGALDIKGLRDVRAAFIRRLVPWHAGDSYRQDKVAALERTLLGTGLFRSATLRHASELAPDGTLPVTLRVEESKPHSIGGGVRYSTSEGPGLTAFWEHRNLFGEGERLRLTTRIAQLDQLAGATIAKPAFLRRNQTLLGDLTLEHETPEGFERTGLEGSVGLERALSRTTTVQGRVSGEFSWVNDAFGQRDLVLLGLPLGVRFDASDSLLDPTKGFRTSLNVTPFTGSDQGGRFGFTRGRLAASAYVPFDRRRRFVGAIRGNVGSIVGAGRDRIPANHRLYSGGGGSVRGYASQLIGPLDARNEPLGGRSVAEAGLELRLRLWKNIGIVPFVEGGNVSDDPVPNVAGPFRWGAGLGGRYYTSFGPIRLDIAVPLNRRDGIDDPFQIYVSVGQAF